jgi:hypothetical protein
MQIKYINVNCCFFTFPGRSGELMRVVEVFLNHVSWRLTQPDGQLQIVNANLMNLR